MSVGLSSASPGVSAPQSTASLRLLTISLYGARAVSVGSASCAIVFCIVWSTVFHLEDITRTHCNVSNYVPSISAATGDYWPQRDVMALLISLSTCPRFVNIAVQFRRDVCTTNSMPCWYRAWHKPGLVIVMILQTMEVLGLLLLSVVTSSEDFDIHAIGFGTFLGCGIASMVLSCIQFLLMNLETLKHFSKVRVALKQRCQLLAVNILSLLLFLYFYYRHSEYCETGVYSLAALFEYILVFTNILYQWVTWAIEVKITFSKCEREKLI